MKEIDYSQIIDSDDLDNAMDHIRGIEEILNAMQLSIASGGTISSGMAFFILQNSCNAALKEFEDMKPKIDLMLEQLEAVEKTSPTRTRTSDDKPKKEFTK